MMLKSKFVFDFHRKIIKLADEFDMLAGTRLLIIAVSGGADSMSLLEVFTEISVNRGFEIVAAHFNHKLRGDESDRDEAFVTGQCLARNIRLITGSADVKKYSVDNGIGIEEAARDCRYKFLFDVIRQLQDSDDVDKVRIATAHNADDLAETVIFNLTRGTGTGGLLGIPPVRDEIIRPMLHISRAEIMEYIRIKGIKYVEDSTNSLTNQTRNIIRHNVMPVLKEINPRFTETVVKSSELLRCDEEYLSSLALKYLESQDTYRFENYLSLKSLNSLPLPVKSRVFKLIGGNNFSYKHIIAIHGLCGVGNPKRLIMLPGMTIQRKYNKIYFFPLSS